MLRKLLRQSFSQSKVEIRDSGIVVDYDYFRKTSLFSRAAHFIKNRNSLFDMKRNFQDFNAKTFPNKILQEYKKMEKCYSQRDHRNMQNFVSEELFKAFKASVKQTPKSQPLKIRWQLIHNPTKAEIIQARIHNINLTRFKVIDRWFQLILKFSNDQGQQTYNVLERHEKGKKFRFVKFDI